MRVLLIIVYFVVFCPIGIISRLIYRIDMQLKQTEQKSYFKTINHQFERKDIINKWC